METGNKQTTDRPKRKRSRKALWLGLFVVLAVVTYFGCSWLRSAYLNSAIHSEIEYNIEDNAD